MFLCLLYLVACGMIWTGSFSREYFNRKEVAELVYDVVYLGASDEIRSKLNMDELRECRVAAYNCFFCGKRIRGESSDVMNGVAWRVRLGHNGCNPLSSCAFLFRFDRASGEYQLYPCRLGEENSEQEFNEQLDQKDVPKWNLWEKCCVTSDGALIVPATDGSDFAIVFRLDASTNLYLERFYETVSPLYRFHLASKKDEMRVMPSYVLWSDLVKLNAENEAKKNGGPRGNTPAAQGEPEKPNEAPGETKQDLKQDLKQENPEKTLKGDCKKMNNLFGDFTMRQLTDENVASTLLGVAVKVGDAWRIYDKSTGTITDLGDVQLGNFPIYVIPALKLEAGDIIVENGKYYCVTGNKNGRIQTVDVATARAHSVVPVQNILGFSIYQKVVAMTDLLDDKDGSGNGGLDGLLGDEMGDLVKLSVLSSMTQDGDGNQMNPLLALAALGKGSGNMRKLMWLSIISGGIGNGGAKGDGEKPTGGTLPGGDLIGNLVQLKIVESLLDDESGGGLLDGLFGDKKPKGEDAPPKATKTKAGASRPKSSGGKPKAGTSKPKAVKKPEPADDDDNGPGFEDGPAE